MKIGVVGSGYDMLPLRQIVSQYDHEYIFLVDNRHWPWSEKDRDIIFERAVGLIEFGISKGVDTFIVPAQYEFVLQKYYQTNYDKHGDYAVTILPLFDAFLKASVQHSRVGKLGVISTVSDIEHTQKSLIQCLNQKKRDGFPVFSRWIKQIRAIPLFVPLYSKSDRMVRKTIKTELRYFRDADVDTLFPYSWDVLYYDKVISHMFTGRRIRYCGRKFIEPIIAGYLQENQSDYSCTILTTQEKAVFLTEKKRSVQLSKGGLCDLHHECIVL